MPLDGLRYRSSARFHDTTRFPSRALRRITLAVLRTLGQGFLLLLITAAVLASLGDLAIQFIRSGRASLISDVAITFGSYVLVVSPERWCMSPPNRADTLRYKVVVSLSIILWRLVRGRAAISVIPKGYIPTQQSDVPKVSPSHPVRAGHVC